MAKNEAGTAPGLTGGGVTKLFVEEVPPHAHKKQASDSRRIVPAIDRMHMKLPPSREFPCEKPLCHLNTVAWR
jgi:hypothetical protein